MPDSSERRLPTHSLPFVGSNHTIRYLDGRPEFCGGSDDDLGDDEG